MSRVLAAVAAIAAAAAAVVLWQRQAQPRFERQIEWAGRGVWLKAETHVHSRFSDGGHAVDEIVDRAVANGCQVLAITDHTDSGLQAATPGYHDSLDAARARAPELVLLTGFEWNVPPGKGQDHALVLLPPGLDGEEIWSDFKRRFDDLDKEGENPGLAADAFSWMRSLAAEETAGPPIVFLSHPSRRAPDIATVSRQLEFLSGIGKGIFVGVEGAPGHQKATPLGAYDRTLTPEDRWDPAIAVPGQAWDQQLAAGETLSGALATSDFHADSNGDYWPCEFSATWIYARERSSNAVIQALRAGSFAGAHGGIARDIQLAVAVEGLPRPALAGESLRVPAGTRITVSLSATVPPTDWAGQPNQVDQAEILGITTSNTAVLASGPFATGTLSHSMTVPSGGLTVRARGRRVVADGPDLLFYTNAISVR